MSYITTQRTLQTEGRQVKRPRFRSLLNVLRNRKKARTK